MKVLLNGQELDQLDQRVTLGSALLAVQDQHIGEDEVIVGILLDGEPLTAESLSAWKDRPVGDFQEARIDAPTRAVLAAKSLRLLAEGLAGSDEERQDITRHIHQGQSVEAMKLLPGYLGIWESLQQSLGAVERLLEIDLNTVELYSGTGTDGEPSLLTDHILRLSGQLAEMKTALEGGDLVMLGDILDYEFSELTEVWGTILGELAVRFDETDN